MHPLLAKLRRQLRAHPGQYAIVLGLVLLGQLGALAMPAALKLVVDAVTGDTQADLDLMCLAFLGLLVLQVLCVRAYSVRLADLEQQGWREFVVGTYASILRRLSLQPSTERAGELATRLSAASEKVAWILGRLVHDVAVYGSMCLGALALMLWLSPPLALILGICVLLLGGLDRLLSDAMRRRAAHRADAQAAMGAHAQDTLAGAEIVEILGAADQEREACAAHARLASDRELEYVRLDAWHDALSEVSSYLGVVVVLWSGGQLVADGVITPGTLAAFAVYAVMATRAMRHLARLRQKVRTLQGDTDALFQAAEQFEHEETPAEMSLPERGGLRLEAVDYAWPARPEELVVRAIDLEVRPGEVIAFVGSSGAGKSTLLRLAAGLVDPGSGCVRWAEQELEDWPISGRRAWATLVPAEPTLFAATLRDNVVYGAATAGEDDLHEALSLAEAHFAHDLPQGLDTWLGDRAHQLSTGQRQRLAIARALLRKPRILALDEALAAIDAPTAGKILEHLAALDEPPILLLAAHRLSTAVAADRVVFLEDGRAVAVGPHHELLASHASYRRLVADQLVDGRARPVAVSAA